MSIEEKDPTIAEISHGDNEAPEEILTPEVAPESTPEITPEVAPEVTPEVVAEGDTPPVIAAEGDTPPVIEFEPDYKFKVRDEEHEIEEWARPFIKDAETQKKFQDLYTRGHGLEIAKAERDDFKQKFTGLEDSLQVVNSFVQQHRNNPGNPQVGHAAAEKFINSLGLPPEMFLQYALEKLKYQQLPPEQQQVIDQQRQQESDYEYLQQNNQQLQQQNMQMLVQQRSSEIDAQMADAKYAPLISEYETQVGKPGAFKELVIQRGIYHDQINKTDIAPAVAIQEVMQMLGLQARMGQPGTASIPQTAQPGTVPVQQQKPVIPNIAGQPTASPAKPVVNSLDDIRRLAAQAE